MFLRRCVGPLMVLLIAVTWAACGSPAAPAAVSGAPLAITSFSVSTTRAEVDQDVKITSVVVNHATPIGEVTYVWSANIGTITGTDTTATWHAVKNTVQTPADVTITLTVSEQYRDLDAASGLPVTRTTWVMQVAPVVRLHDSDSELTKMSVSFLVKRFGNSSISPAMCLVDFSDTCPGKADEFSDITNNRATHIIYFAQAFVKSIVYDSPRTFANIVAPCVFHDVYLPTDQVEIAKGNCLLTGLYEKRRWWMCDSHFQSPATGQIQTMREFFRGGGIQ